MNERVRSQEKFIQNTLTNKYPQLQLNKHHLNLPIQTILDQVEVIFDITARNLDMAEKLLQRLTDSTEALEQYEQNVIQPLKAKAETAEKEEHVLFKPLADALFTLKKLFTADK